MKLVIYGGIAAIIYIIFTLGCSYSNWMALFKFILWIFWVKNVPNTFFLLLSIKVIFLTSWFHSPPAYSSLHDLTTPIKILCIFKADFILIDFVYESKFKKKL